MNILVIKFLVIHWGRGQMQSLCIASCVHVKACIFVCSCVYTCCFICNINVYLAMCNRIICISLNRGREGVCT